MDFYQILASIITAFLVGMGTVIWNSYKNLQSLNMDIKSIAISLNHTVESLKTTNDTMAKALIHINMNNLEIAVLRSRIEYIEKYMEKYLDIKK